MYASVKFVVNIKHPTISDDRWSSHPATVQPFVYLYDFRNTRVAAITILLPRGTGFVAVLEDIIDDTYGVGDIDVSVAVGIPRLQNRLWGSATVKHVVD
jgi:hypothetical protein